MTHQQGRKDYELEAYARGQQLGLDDKMISCASFAKLAAQGCVYESIQDWTLCEVLLTEFSDWLAQTWYEPSGSSMVMNLKDKFTRHSSLRMTEYFSLQEWAKNSLQITNAEVGSRAYSLVKSALTRGTQGEIQANPIPKRFEHLYSTQKNSEPSRFRAEQLQTELCEVAVNAGVVFVREDDMNTTILGSALQDSDWWFFQYPMAWPGIADPTWP